MNIATDSEVKRLADLETLHIIHSAAEAEYDSIVEQAANLFHTPIALISLVADNFQWFKAKKGIDSEQTGRDVSFCAHAIEQDNIYIVENAENDVLFQKNSLVTGSPHIRFYAGAPLQLPGGSKIGTLCIIDNQPRKIAADQQQLLLLLAKQVVQLLLKRKAELEQLVLKSQLEQQQLHVQSAQLKAAHTHLKTKQHTAAILKDIEIIREGKFTRKSLSAFCDMSTEQLNKIDLISIPVSLHPTQKDGVISTSQQSLNSAINELIKTNHFIAEIKFSIQHDISPDIFLSLEVLSSAQLIIEHFLCAIACLENESAEVELYAAKTDGLQLSFLLTGFQYEPLQEQYITTPAATIHQPDFLFLKHLHLVQACIKSINGHLSFQSLSKKLLCTVIIPKID